MVIVTRNRFVYSILKYFPEIGSPHVATAECGYQRKRIDATYTRNFEDI